MYIYINVHIWWFPYMEVPKMVSFSWKISLKWMIWGYPYFKKPHETTIYIIYTQYFNHQLP